MSTPEGYIPVTLDLVAKYRSYFLQTPRKSADYTFTNLWGWAEYMGMMLSFREDLCWICQTRPFIRYWAPVGDWNKADWAAQREIREGIAMHRVPAELVSILTASLGASGRLQVEDSREQWEYLYSQEELATLPGNKFHKKKNHVNKFRKTYGEDYRVLSSDTPDSIEDILLLQEEWCRWRDCESSPALQAEKDVIFRVVGNWGRLGTLLGGALYVEDKMVAFSIGEALDENSLVAHFEKVQPDYSGVYQAINNAFARYAGRGFDIINREQDMGEEGLRQAKETYYPIGFLEKSRVVVAAAK